MIEKLESAGLGFYVKAVDTTQKLGKLKSYVYTYMDYALYMHMHVHAGQMGL